MTRLARSALLVALYLLASIATAYAECAWVVWSDRVMTPQGGNPSRYWRISGTAVSRDACLATQRSAMSASVANLPSMGATSASIIEPDLVVSSGGTPPSTIEDFRCLPDTVDRRGPKAK